MTVCKQCGDEHPDTEAYCPRAKLPVSQGPIGSVISHYKIDKLIAMGGMGGIYTAKHSEDNTTVAIKLLRAELAKKTDILERFRREARAAASIGHPHIVHIVDFGTTDWGEPYMIMEYLLGQDLEHALKSDGAFPIKRAVNITLQILDAIGAAHAQHIVHRDMKLANVFLLKTAPDGTERDFIKLLDFGVSKVSEAQAQHLTRTGTMLGTPIYMPPEQLQNARLADHRVDLYAVAVILYRLIAKKIPFNGTSYEELLIRSVVDPPNPIRSVEPSVSEELAAVIEKGMAKKPDDRYATSAAFAEALRDATKELFASDAQPQAADPQPAESQTKDKPETKEPAQPTAPRDKMLEYDQPTLIATDVDHSQFAGANGAAQPASTTPTTPNTEKKPEPVSETKPATAATTAESKTDSPAKPVSSTDPTSQHRAIKPPSELGKYGLFAAIGLVVLLVVIFALTRGS